MKNINENWFIITLTAVVFGLIGYLFGKQSQKNQCPMMAKGIHKTHAMRMEKMHGDKVYVWKSDEMTDDENLEISIDTLSGTKQIKLMVKKEKEE